MNIEQAKAILQHYRPSIDAEEPYFREALEQVRRDPNSHSGSLSTARAMRQCVVRCAKHPCPLACTRGFLRHNAAKLVTTY